MTALPPFPGGFNSYATAVNNRGEIVGWGRERCCRPTCNTALQTLQFPSGDLGKRWHDEGTPAAPRRFHERRQRPSMTEAKSSASPGPAALRSEASVPPTPFSGKTEFPAKFQTSEGIPGILPRQSIIKVRWWVSPCPPDRTVPETSKHSFGPKQAVYNGWVSCRATYAQRPWG